MSDNNKKERRKSDGTQKIKMDENFTKKIQKKQRARPNMEK